MSPRWLILGITAALSPALLGTLQHVAHEPWKAPSLCALAILVVAVGAQRDRAASLAPRAALWVVAAVLLQLVAAAAGWAAGHRLALGLGTIGFLRISGWASLPTSLWVLPALPPPTGLADLTSPALEGALSRTAALALPGGMFPLPLHEGDGGLVAMVLGAAFGLASSQAAGRGLRAALLAITLGIIAGLVAQLLGFWMAGALAGSAGDTAARWVLDLGPGFLVGIVGIWVLCRHTAGPETRNPFASSAQMSGESS